MISATLFREYFELLCERYSRNFSSNAIDKVYYQYLSPKLDDNAFEQTVMLWVVENDKFPSPKDLYERWQIKNPAPQKSTPGIEGKLYHELTETERRQSDEARDRIWALLQHNRPQYVKSCAGFSSIGDALMPIQPVGDSADDSRRDLLYAS